ncbi:MAG: hypothetical protein RI964_2905 [Pseudomonadota bacterium]
MIYYISSWQEPCGIAGYTSDLKNAVEKNLDEVVKVIKIPQKELKESTQENQEKILLELISQIPKDSTVHIQHEFSFFGQDLHSSCNLFSWFLAEISHQRKVIITFHTIIKNESLKSITKNFKVKKFLSKFIRSTITKVNLRKIARTINKNKIQCIVHNNRSCLNLHLTGINEENIKVVPLGVNNPPNKFTSRNDAKSILGYEKNDILVGLFGFVANYKGPDIATKAILKLPKQYKLAIVGGRHPQNNNDHIISKILEIKTKNSTQENNKIILTGYLPKETIDLYRMACDIVIAPYREVGLSSSAAVTWALTSGNPLVASNIEAFKDIHDTYECMLMVGSEQIDETAWAIQKIYEDKELSQKLVHNAEKYVEKNNWENISKLYKKIYKIPTT